MQSKICLVACEHCHTSKKKCDGNDPCKRCVELNIPCTRNRTSRYGTERKFVKRCKSSSNDDHHHASSSGSSSSSQKKPRKNKEEEGNATQNFQRQQEAVVSISEVRITDELMDAAMLSQLLGFARIYGGILFNFIKQMGSTNDIAHLFATPARQVRTDALLTYYSRAAGFVDLSVQLQQRAIVRSQGIMEDFSNDSASALFALALCLCGSDMARSRHMLRICNSLYREANPDKTPPTRVMELLTKYNRNSLIFLFIQAMSLFIDEGLELLFRHTMNVLPIPAEHVRAALQRHQISSNLGPFDWYQFVGVSECSNNNSISSSSNSNGDGSGGSNNSSSNNSNRTSGEEPPPRGTLVNLLQDEQQAMLQRQQHFDKVGMEEGEKSVQRSKIFSLTQVAIMHLLLQDQVACKASAYAAIELMEQFPPSFLPAIMVVYLSHLFDASIQMKDLDFFLKCMEIAKQMSAIPAAAALVTALTDVPTRYSMVSFSEVYSRSNSPPSSPVLFAMDEQFPADDEAYRFENILWKVDNNNYDDDDIDNEF